MLKNLLFLLFPFLNTLLPAVILGAGLWLTVCTCCVQFRLFPEALLFLVRSRREKGGISPFRALCTALSATVGTGNLVGVAGALCLGGPGVVFWMLVSAALSMAVKFAEAALCVHYRIRQGRTWIGGPMYMIQQGLGGRWMWLARCYCLFGILASFGVGNMAQINAITVSTRTIISDPENADFLCLLLAVLLIFFLFRGENAIGSFAEHVIPWAAGFYIVLCLALLMCRADMLFCVLSSIWKGAFSPRAVTGGMIGSALITLRTGCSRAVFSNEAGMGTAGIAHAASEVDHCVQQGLLGMMEVFLDTAVICSLTALAILCSGVDIPYGNDVGASLTFSAFSSVFGTAGGKLIAVFLACFSFATVLGWSYYGIRCASFLFGKCAVRPFLALQAAATFLGLFVKTPFVWKLSEIMNFLMAIPNLTAMIFLTPQLIQNIHSYTHDTTICHWR